MLTPKTSESDPLRIAAVTPGDGQGRIGITLCPGKTDPATISGAWARDLDTDLDAIQRWGATAVVSLITDEEIDHLSVRDLPKGVRDRHLEWWHAPIPDGRPPGPEFEAAWAVAGEAIRDRLRLGFDVLIHCRGGLGRAGTIAARLLVELGARPNDAIRRVRDARSRYAIETMSQEVHVAQCTLRAPLAPSRSAEDIRDRALGAFLGLAVGDAVGTTLEFCSRDAQPRLQDLVGGGPFELPPGAWTDDTAMALALADSLAASETLDCRDLMDRFIRWWQEGDYSCTGHCFDIGNTTRQALDRYRRTGDPLAGSTDPQSAGNGSLMRLAPVALRFWHDRPRLIADAADQSRTTHGAEEAVGACRAFAELLAEAIAGSPRADLLARRSFEGAPAVARVMAGSWRGRPRNRIRSSGYVVHTLEAAIWSVARTGDFRNAVLLAANLADDADTVAAVTGQLAGALYGLSGIPDSWLERVAWKDRLLEAAQRLLSASLADRAESAE
ncbi:MAG: ADP-ribosylglycohydrolase family protein [Truepera sp.]|nr:ADP-ribosylglycohydrolase family protein [Truepera sp.]